MKAIGYLILITTISDALNISYMVWQSIIIGLGILFLSQEDENIFSFYYEEKDEEDGR